MTVKFSVHKKIKVQKKKKKFIFREASASAAVQRWQQDGGS